MQSYVCQMPVRLGLYRIPDVPVESRVPKPYPNCLGFSIALIFFFFSAPGKFSKGRGNNMFKSKVGPKLLAT